MIGAPPEVRAERLSAWFGAERILTDLDLVCPAGRVTALIGPTSSGKSTFLRMVNRLVDDRDDFRSEGVVRIGPSDVTELDPIALRRRVGMVFSKPVPFRLSIYDNVVFGLRLASLGDERECARRAEDALRRVGLWGDVEPILDGPVSRLGVGQQQRLCLARALALQPDVVLLDQPTLALDPVETSRFEEIVHGIRGQCTIVLVTHDVQQAGRLADVTAFLERGALIEAGATEDLFTRPRTPATQAYLSGRRPHE